MHRGHVSSTDGVETTSERRDGAVPLHVAHVGTTWNARVSDVTIFVRGQWRCRVFVCVRCACALTSTAAHVHATQTPSLSGSVTRNDAGVRSRACFPITMTIPARCTCERGVRVTRVHRHCGVVFDLR